MKFHVKRLPADYSHDISSLIHVKKMTKFENLLQIMD